MKTLGYYNGKFDEVDKMMVPMNDRACYFGDGVYDATLSRNYNIFAVDEHIDRFYNSAALMKIDIPYTKAEIRDLLNEMVQKTDDGNVFTYWQVTRGTGMRNHAFPDCKANLWIMLKPAELKDMDKKMKLVTAEDTRFLHCNVKTLNLLPSVMAAGRAEAMGCDETIFHRSGRVTECAHSNVHIIQDGMLKTAPADNLILPGIARAHMIAMCKKLGIGVSEVPYTLDELMNAEEVLVSSSSQLCMAVESVDGQPVGGKQPELLKTLQQALLEEFYAATDKINKL